MTLNSIHNQRHSDGFIEEMCVKIKNKDKKIKIQYVYEVLYFTATEPLARMTPL